MTSQPEKKNNNLLPSSNAATKKSSVINPFAKKSMPGSGFLGASPVASNNKVTEKPMD